jgi:penicillin-binding protein-related factor A (putative recombinase)
MEKLETKLSKKWIDELKKEVSEKGEHIKCIKIHGNPMQERGISDYLICYKGKFIAIEFKTENRNLTDYQLEFGTRIKDVEGIFIIITFLDNTFNAFDVDYLNHEMIRYWNNSKIAIIMEQLK